MARKRSGLIVIDTIAATTSDCVARSGSMPRSRPSAAKMNENSPIWANPKATVSAVRAGRRSATTTRNAASGFPTRTIAIVAKVRGRFAAMACGSRSMPIDTKKRTAKASRMGIASDAARAEIRLTDDHTGQKRAERHRCAEKLGRPDGDPEDDDQNGECEELARACLGDVREELRNETPTHEQHERDQRRDFGE